VREIAPGEHDVTPARLHALEERVEPLLHHLGARVVTG
jgi:hypothetical protein